MITMCNKTTSNTSMFALRETFLDAITTLAAILRTERGRYFHKLTPSVCGFGLSYRYERVPACISNTFCQMMIFQHPGNIQIFKCYLIIFFDQLKRFFMMKIIALALNFQVLASYFINRLLAVVTAT